MPIPARPWSCVPEALLRSLSAPLLAFFIAIPAAFPVNAASPPEAGTATNERSFQCRYQATAYVTFLSIPIFSRSGVGFGLASADEYTDRATKKLSLRFLSGSIPERAHGLNRFGFIQENVEEKDQATVSANYFGLMTANGEESLSQAKAALDSAQKVELPFVAVHAFVNRRGMSYSVRHLLLPSFYRGSNADQLLKQMQAEFTTPQPGEEEKTESVSGQPSETFLNSLRQAILTEAADYQSRIVFNGKIFRFQAAKHQDPKTGADLQKAGLTNSPDLVVQLSGVLRNEKTNEVTNFRLWFEKGAANFLPLRFEFKAKSYLRLVFDQEPPPAPEQLSVNRESAQ